MKAIRGESSKPATEKYRGTWSPACRAARTAPSAIMSLAQTTAVQPRSMRAPAAAPAAGPVAAPEDARAGRGLDRFVAALRDADTDALRAALRRWKAAADPVTAAGTERRLLLAELGAGVL
ncbi:hypothetical protein GCM10010345_76990 [Streptomyces canarius]|uniref:Uncharacterized protein n=2 Tax=Streptomyces TaxID=1883 RepID=A0ABQ3D801_9ACTN|nr:hypothetical protein GCM10010345_76990 [Streptomyces canarius]